MPPIPVLFAVTDPGLATVALAAWCAGLAAAGVDAIQLRRPGLDDAALLAEATALRAAFPAPGGLFVNRRFDLALAAGADGVHLPANGLSTARVRAAVGNRLTVGRSTHEIDEVRRARDEGADYVVFGPLFDTPSKRGRIAPRGLDALSRAAEVGVPVVAIGGIDAGRVAAVRRHGAAGVAAIRAFTDAASAAALVAAWRGAGA